MLHPPLVVTAGEKKQNENDGCKLGVFSSFFKILIDKNENKTSAATYGKHLQNIWVSETLSKAGTNDLEFSPLRT